MDDQRRAFRNNFVSSETKTALRLLLGAVGFVLLIACANVACLVPAWRAASIDPMVALRQE